MPAEAHYPSYQPRLVSRWEDNGHTRFLLLYDELAQELEHILFSFRGDSGYAIPQPVLPP